jgi:hypothetical protein
MRFKRKKIKTTKQIGIKIIMIKLDKKKIKLHQIIRNEIEEKKIKK